MIKVMILIAGMLLITGCATNVAINKSDIIQRAAMIAPVDKEMYYTQIPSHGAIGDAVAIAANDGAN